MQRHCIHVEYLFSKFCSRCFRISLFFLFSLAISEGGICFSHSFFFFFFVNDIISTCSLAPLIPLVSEGSHNANGFVGGAEGSAVSRSLCLRPRSTAQLRLPCYQYRSVPLQKEWGCLPARRGSTWISA
jgi:hypothetical protein